MRARPRPVPDVPAVESSSLPDEVLPERTSPNAESSNALRLSEKGLDFMWPHEGRVLARYGQIGDGRRNDGINIAGRRGDPVRAVADGVVAYAGNEIRGFGNLLLIRHADGWISAYAHNDQVLVRMGERVRKGQVVSRVGSTGNVGGPQLHFELRRGDRLVNPEPLSAANGGGSVGRRILRPGPYAGECVQSAAAMKYRNGVDRPRTVWLPARRMSITGFGC